MLSATEFIDAVEVRQLVPESLLGRLRQKVQGSSAVVSGAAAAKFLVEAGAITQQQADEILNGAAEGFYAADPDDPDALGPVLRAPTQGDAAEVAEEVVYADPEGVGDSPESLVGKPRARSTRRKHLKQAKSNEFDSPIFLLGGGGLALLLLVGGALAFLIGKESGDEVFRTAQEAYESASYQQAITRFEKFVADYPSHADHSVARVRLAVARIRRALDTAQDPAMALELAQQEVPQIEDEEAFGEGRGELAALLPQIALMLAERADGASREGDVGEAAAASEGSESALAMIANTKYVPKSLREESELTAIRALLTRVRQRAAALEALDVAVAQITAAAAEGDPRSAYKTHREFVGDHPQLADDQKLRASLDELAEAERAAATFVAQSTPASTAEPASPITRTVAVAQRLAKTASDASGVYVSTHAGVAYAVDAASGTLLWRRPLGVSLTPSEPRFFDGRCLLVDHRAGELVAVDERSGQLAWRAAVGTGATTPVIAGERVLVTTRDGELVSLDLGSGDRVGKVAFAQPLSTPPVIDPVKGRLHVVGEAASLYTLQADTLECVAVTVDGHAAGAVATPPVMVENTLVLFDNVGFETAMMRVYRIGDGGVPAGLIAEERLDGAVTTPASVVGRRLAVSTNKGEASLFEIVAGDEGQRVTRIAISPAPQDAFGPRAVAYAAGAFWIADDRLTKGLPSLADKRLVPEPIEEAFGGDRFAGPLVVRDRTLLHARRSASSDAVIVGATRVEDGAALWQTQVSVSPLGDPQPVSKPAGVMTLATSGDARLVARAAIDAGLDESPFIRPRTRRGAPLRYEHHTSLGPGRVVMSLPGVDRYLAVAAAPSPRAATVRLPDKLATRPAAMGRGWLAPLSIGQVLLLSQSGREIATPFQPTIKPGELIDWLAPAVAEVAGTPHAVTGDAKETVYCLTLAADGKRLELAASHRLAGAQAIGPIGVAGPSAVVGLSAGRIAIYQLPELAEPQIIEINGAIAWGPHGVGEDGSLALIATGSGELIGIDCVAGAIVWRHPLTDGELLGAPLTDDDGIVLATERGTLLRLASETGDVATRVELGEMLGSGPTAVGSNLLLCASDGALLLVPKP